MSEVRDRWGAGSAYEGFMGRWSRPLATRFVGWLAPRPAAHWLDVGCGTGALANALCELASPASVTGCDPTEAFLSFARERATDERLSFVVAGAGNLPARPGGYDSITSLLALNFIPDPAAALAEMRSLATRGGTISACVWDYAGGMEFLRRFWDVVGETDPAANALDEGTRFPLCHPGPLTELFRSGGLTDVRCEPIEVATRFADFEDYWRPFLGGTGPAPSYVTALDEDRRQRLARTLEQRLARQSDGSILLAARAWAVRASVDGA